MSKSLLIAEKPSVATDLARVLAKQLGKFEKKGRDRNTYFENDRAVISSAVGHLAELKMPAGPNGKKLPWGIKHLPVIPERFELQPIEKSESRLKLLIRLIKRKDVGEIVNACDAGREGELIFRYVMAMADVEKPIRRMWMQSMTNGSIREAFGALRSDEEMLPLADAALCRSESDWLVGLNGTRALTAYNSRHGGFNVTPAGRVQTPTLVILAEREREIRSFVSRDYYEVHAQFEVATGHYSGRWFREDFKKDKSDDQARAERLWSEEEAQAVVDRCQGQVGEVSESKKPARQAPPQLFDLTALQREASGRFGFSARRTLQLAQALYERHKLLTYPRTDSRCLPEDYLDEVRSNLRAFSEAGEGSLAPEIVSCSRKVLEKSWLKRTKRVFDNAKISDHFAIVPTGKIPTAALRDDEKKIFDIVSRRLVAIFFPPAEFENTRRITRVGVDSFLTTGKVLVKPGYLEVYGRKPGVATDKDDLVAAETGEEARVLDVEARNDQTKPPGRFTEASLLSAMETAGKRVEDEELRDAMKERGLGTPATRAAIIEGLISQKYLFRHEQQKRDLVVSNKGLALIDLLDEIGLDALSSPELTGEWEHKLKEMQAGRLDRSTFMDEIKALTTEIVERTAKKMRELAQRAFPDLDAPCPSCGAQGLKQTDGSYECRNADCKPRFKLKKYIASHELTPEEVAGLIEEGRVGPYSDFKNRFGKPFTAELELTKNARGSWKTEFVFEGDDERKEEADNLSEDQLLCEAPLPDGSVAKVYETDRAYICPEMAPKTQKGGTRIGKTILKRDIPPEQARKLFADGKTDLMEGFVSKRGRKFGAYLLLDRATGKLNWEFPPRAKKAPRKKKQA